MPCSTAPPPVSTTPDVRCPPTPARSMSLRTSARISSQRGSMTSASARGESLCGGRPPMPAHLDAQVGRRGDRQRRAAALLQALRVGERRAQRGGEVVGDVAAADREHRGVADRPAVPDHRRRRPGPDLDQGHAQLALLGRQHGLGRGERAAEHVLHVEPGAVAALDEVLPRADRAGHDVDARLEADAGHARPGP